MINKQKSISERAYDYIVNSCTVNRTGLQYAAKITFGGHTFIERSNNSPLDARRKLANELSKSKFIQNNLNTYANI